MAKADFTRILIVDDEDSFRLSVEMALKMQNDFAVRSCNSSESAVEMLKKDQFDVILLDQKMDDMTGLQVLEWMHSQEIQTPVIMITAAGSEAVAVEAMKLGAYDYLRKDQLDIERLSLAVRSVYERYLYRRQIIERQAEKRLLKEKQKELDSLRLFHNTVNSVGQLLEKNIADLQKNLRRYEADLPKAANEPGAEGLRQLLAELRESVDVLSSGVASMRGLSSVVTHKLDEIQIAPKATEALEKDGGLPVG
jgi:DNA-binding NtrC family response regulator